jgi:anthranilate phosphoribosyltransferase
MIREYISRVVAGEDLSSEEMGRAMELILDGSARPSQVAAFLVGLRAKGETPDEIAAAARAVHRHTPAIQADGDLVVLDRDEINLDEETVSQTCSLDAGDTRTFNISTATALIAAGGGLKAAKYGARAESTFCGSANVVTALGVNLDCTLTEVERCIDKVGLGFLYANLFTTPLALPTQVRGEIGVRTVFNLIGPLANPAGARRQVLGVYSPERTELMAEALRELGFEAALVVYGRDTRDELSVTGPSRISRLIDGSVETMEVVPADVGLTPASPDEIRGGTAEVNADIIRGILAGEKGPRRDVALLNAAAAFWISGKAAGLREGIDLAAESVDSGRAKGKLEELVAFTAACGVYQHKDVS